MDPIVTTKNGSVRGKLTKINSCTSKSIFSTVKFANIPYAKCPRFKKPIPVENWDGERDGTGETSYQPQINTVAQNIKCLDGAAFFDKSYADRLQNAKMQEETLHLTVRFEN